MSASERDLVVITGIAGGIGARLAQRLEEQFEVVGFDQECAEDERCYPLDLTDPETIEKALAELREDHGNRIASVIHLAAYFDFSGDESPLYDEVNVKGTLNLLDALRDFEVEQFVYTSTMLVHAPTEPGIPITEDSPLDARWPYPQSKLETEGVIDDHDSRLRRVVLRIAGAYSEQCGVPTLAHQIQRIYERDFKSHVFAGDASRGQSFVHMEDVIDAVVRTVENRDVIEDGTRILIGEERVLTYEALQNRIAQLVHGESITTLRLPKPVAKTGAWLREKAEPVVPDDIDEGEKPFIRPFMISMADDHYELDTSRARELLEWEPRHSLYDELPAMVESLKDNPKAWYEANGLRLPEALRDVEQGERIEELRVEYERKCRTEHAQNLWAHFLTIGMGLWLMTSPPILNYESGALAVSDIASGLLLVIFGSVALSWKHPWARAVNGAIGLYLLFAPLIFWAPTAAAYLNDTLVGAVVIGLAMLVRPAIGVSPVAALEGPDIPPGWDYTPSSWEQRLPIIFLAFIGLYISRYLTAYQLGHLPFAWDPFFGDGTERVITSEVSEAWPVPDAGVGAATYMLEILTGIIGSRRRWRTMPWLVVLFGVMIVPLGAVSIFFIIIQPIVIGTWCTLCLVAAAAMLAQIPYSLDELIATGQFLRERKRQGRPLWIVFLRGDTMEGGEKVPATDFERPATRLFRDALGGGVNLPWNLVLSALIGVWLMFTRVTLGTEAPLAHADHLIGALVVTVSITAFAEVARPARFMNALLGICLLAAPFMFDGGSTLAMLGSLAAGVALIALSVPRGRVSHRYAGWNRLIF